MEKAPLRILISGGGTGGHIHPAIAIAEGIQAQLPDAQIEFVGALGRMEMDRIPAAGYTITGLPITGIDRKLSRRNLGFPWRLIRSLIMARRIIRRFKPDVAVGVGGFASGPLLWMASKAGIPTLIQEQNGFPGITNRLLSGRVQKVCAGFPWPRKVVSCRQDFRNWQSTAPQHCRPVGVRYRRSIPQRHFRKGTFWLA